MIYHKVGLYPTTITINSNGTPEMTGSQDFTATAPPMAGSQHSPASTSSVSSSGSYGYSSRHTNQPPPRTYHSSSNPTYPTYAGTPECPADTSTMGSTSGPCTYPPVMNCDTAKGQHMSGGENVPPPYMGWEGPDGVTHYTPVNYQYEAGFPVVITPPNGTTTSCDPNHGVTVTMCNNGPTGESNNRGQHTVHFHVHQGEAVSLQLGEQVQMIQGPATVRMVSTNHEPPVPLPVQVPPGHFVHQVVDENGILQHVILSQHPAYVPVPQHANGTNQNGWSSQGYVDPSAPPPAINGANFPTSAPPPAYWNNNRSEIEPRPPKSNSKRNRDHDRRYKGKPSGSSSPSLSVQSTPPQSPVKPRGNAYNGRGSGCWKGSNVTVDDSDESGIGINNDEDQEEKQLLLEILSNIRTPSVPEIRARSALLVWSRPVCEAGDSKFDTLKPIPESDLEYEVLMSDKGKEGKYRSIFSGASMECYLTDLRPHTEYHIRVHAVLKSMNLKGGASDTVSFETNACEPDQPAPPKQTTRSKTSIQLRWNAPNDNGAHIQHYVLESDEGSSISGQGGHFVTIYEGRARAFNVPKLQPSTPYKFRLIAVNELGKSRPSEIASFTTQGSAPSQPVPPSVAEITESTLRLLWSKRPCDDEFTLQMDDMITGHGFLPQYNGPEVEHIVTGLRRNTSYRFKLRAHNEMGASQYSSDVTYTTKPGRPGPPPKPQTKGRIRAHSFRVVWNVPSDNGGSNLTGYHLETDDGSGWISVYTGEELEFNCDHLQPGTQYRVRVAAESAGGVSDYSETCFVITEPVVPDAPCPPTLRDKPKSMSLHLAWKAPEYDGGAAVTEFEIDMTSPDNITRSVYRGRDTECVVASLLPGRPYLFQVRAQNRAGPGPWSVPLEVISGAGPPDRPKEPKAFAKSGTCATVSWDQPINNGAIITGYRLEMASVSNESPDLLESDSEDENEVLEDDLKEEPEDEVDPESDIYEDDSETSDIEDHIETTVENKVCDTKEESIEEPGDSSFEEPPPEPKELVWKLAYSGSDNSTEIKDISPATQYQIRVCAINSAGASAYSCNVSMVTPASTPAVPHSLQVYHSTSSSLNIKWKRPSDHGAGITHYNVEWGINEKELSSVVADKRRISLTDLKPDTSYSIRVQAENAMGKGQFTPMLKVATRPLPPAPPKLECVNASHNQMKLRWGDAKITIGTNYVLEMENSRKVWYQVYNGNNHAYKASKLMENTEYRYRISAITEAGQGPFSNIYTFKTTYAPPPPVKGTPRVSNITDSGCLVQWSGLRSMGAGDQLQYRVQLTRVKDQQVSTYDAGMDIQFRIAGLEPKADYTVRVCAVRLPTNEPDVTLVGTYSPTTQLATLPKAGPVVSNTPVSKQEVVKASGEPSWTDQQWAVIILCGFTLFALIIAMVIQQLISWGTVSS